MFKLDLFSIARVLARVRKRSVYKHVHQAADAFRPEVQQRVLGAFQQGHAALDRAKLVTLLASEDHAGLMIAVDRAITATERALHESALEDVFLAVMKQSGDAATQKLQPKVAAADPKVEFAFDVTSQAAVDWAKKHAAELVKGVSKASREDIRQLVEDAFTEQLTVDELAAEIESVIGDEARAESIARTETMRASNAGQQEAWSQATKAGLLIGDEQQEWVVTPDDRLCPVCEDLDGQTVGLDESFETKDGDRVDGPPAHPNCRCALGLVLAPITAMLRVAYSPDQKRDQHGMFAGTGAEVNAAVGLHGPTRHGEKVEQYGVRVKPSIKTVRISNLVSTQKGFDKAKVEHYIKNPSTLRPLILIRNGRHLIVDGHHRIIAAVKRGIKTIKVDMVEEVNGKLRAAGYNDDEPRDEHGQWTSGGPGSSKMSARAKRALISHKPSTAKMQQHAESNETDVKAMVGGETTGDNAAMDVVVKSGSQLHGVEVKTLLHNSNDKITMHPPSRRRKEAWARKNNAVVHTVVLDDRKGRANSGHRLYYRRGVGAFRLEKMTKVTSAKHLRSLMTAKENE